MTEAPDAEGRKHGREQPEGFRAASELEELLIRAARDLGARPAFYRALLQADVLVLGRAVRVDGGQAQAEEMVTLELVAVNIGIRRLTPVFTSPVRIRRHAARDTPWLKMPFKTVIRNLPSDQGILLNPGSAYGKEFTRSEVERFLDGSMFRPPLKDRVPTRLLSLGLPPRMPEGLVTGLKSLFRTSPQVQTAYLAEVREEGSREAPHLLVAIDATGDFSALAADCEIVVREVPDVDAIVDVTRLEGATLDDWLHREASPFYTKD